MVLEIKKEEEVVCCKCETEVDGEYIYKDKPYCGNCFSELLIVCDECSTIQYEDDTIIENGQVVCNNCLKQKG